MIEYCDISIVSLVNMSAAPRLNISTESGAVLQIAKGYFLFLLFLSERGGEGWYADEVEVSNFPRVHNIQSRDTFGQRTVILADCELLSLRPCISRDPLALLCRKIAVGKYFLPETRVLWAGGSVDERSPSIVSESHRDATQAETQAETQVDVTRALDGFIKIYRWPTSKRRTCMMHGLYIKVTGTRTAWRRVEIRNMHNCTGTTRRTLRANVNDVTTRGAYAAAAIAVVSFRTGCWSNLLQWNMNTFITIKE